MSKLTDNYHYEQICYCCNIPHYIDNYEGNGKELSEVEMEELETALKAESVVREYPTEINADRIRENMAEILVVLEDAVNKECFLEKFVKELTENFEAELGRADEAETEEQHTVEMQLEKTKSAKNKKIKDVIWNVAKVSAGIAILGMGANSVFRKRK